MIRLVLLALALVIAAPTFTPPPAEAQTQKKAEKKKSKVKKGRNDYTAEERAKIMEHARQVCRKSQGAPSTVYRIDYRKMVVYCRTPGSG
jgi:hypothetical protein